MAPTRVLVLLFVAVTLADIRLPPVLALRLPDIVLSSMSGSYESMPPVSHLQKASASSGYSSSSRASDGSVAHIGRALLQPKRVRPISAPSWAREGVPVPVPGDVFPAEANFRRMVVSDDKIAAIEAQLQDGPAVRSAVRSFKAYRSNRREKSTAVARATAADSAPPEGTTQAVVKPSNICLNRDGSVRYNMLSYNNKDFTYLERYPYNTIVKLEVVEYNSRSGREGNRYWCTATALSDVILVTSAHCVKPGTDSAYPDVYTIAHYGYDGLKATAGTRVSRCIAWYDDLTMVDNAIVVLKQPMKLPEYMGYGYINSITPRRNATSYMLSFAADKEEMTCLWDFGIESPYYYGMVETRGTTPNLSYRAGRRCEMDDKYAIWATGSMIGGQSGGCLVHERTRLCIGTAAYTCELPSQCSTECPNAWGGFNAEYPLSDLWQSCGVIANRRDVDSR